MAVHHGHCASCGKFAPLVKGIGGLPNQCCRCQTRQQQRLPDEVRKSYSTIIGERHGSTVTRNH